MRRRTRGHGGGGGEGGGDGGVRLAEGATRRVSAEEEEEDDDDWSWSSVAFAGGGRVAGRATRRAERAARVVRKARRVGRGVVRGCEVGGREARAMGRRAVGTAEARRGDTPIVDRRRARVGGITRPPASTGIARDRESASDEHHIGARA